jgi:hypothetical protein
MTERTTYEIVIRGRASARLLRPLLDDFTFDHGGDDGPGRRQRSWVATDRTTSAAGTARAR